jgi:hypothetical protein
MACSRSNYRYNLLFEILQTLYLPRLDMGVRRDRKNRIQHDQRVSRIENGHLKRDERGRRDIALRLLLGKGTLPYTPTVMNWLSKAIDKRSNHITQGDVDAFLGKK